MSWDELREHADRGVQIGSHTVSHSHLTRLSDAEFQKETREYTVRQDTDNRGVRKSDVLTREAEERMRVILKLQGTEVPDDVVVFSHRGPMTIIEKKVALGKDADDQS